MATTRSGWTAALRTAPRLHGLSENISFLEVGMAKDLSAMAKNNKSYMAKPGEVDHATFVCAKPADVAALILS